MKGSLIHQFPFPWYFIFHLFLGKRTRPLSQYSSSLQVHRLLDMINTLQFITCCVELQAYTCHRFFWKYMYMQMENWPLKGDPWIFSPSSQNPFIPMDEFITSHNHVISRYFFAVALLARCSLRHLTAQNLNSAYSNGTCVVRVLGTQQIDQEKRDHFRTERKTW